MCLQGYILNESGDWNKAISIYSQIKQKFVVDDTYSRLAQASAYYTMSLDLRNNTPDQSNK